MSNEKTNSLNIPQVPQKSETVGAELLYADKALQLTIVSPFDGTPVARAYSSKKGDKIYTPILECGAKFQPYVFSNEELKSAGLGKLLEQCPEGKILEVHLKTSLTVVISDIETSKPKVNGFSFKI